MLSNGRPHRTEDPLEGILSLSPLSYGYMYLIGQSRILPNKPVKDFSFMNYTNTNTILIILIRAFIMKTLMAEIT